MEQVLDEFKMRIEQKKQYREIDFMRKEEDSDWSPVKVEGHDALWNMETDEYVWKNPYYCWRLQAKYESIPCSILDWIREAKSFDNLNKLKQNIDAREKILKQNAENKLRGGPCII